MSDEDEKTDPGQVPPEPARPLNYARPGASAADRRPMPVGVGFVIGFGVFFATVLTWWPIARMSEGALAMGLLLVPVIALLVALILRSAFGWRGVVAGVLIALGLTILIPGVAVLVICGGMRLK